jgi:glycosyltransferase involved in cell wall biosynthesis
MSDKVKVNQNICSKTNFKKNIPVSVIIPCYNCKSTITRAVDSIAAQLCLPYEIILVDDCSLDDTQQFLVHIANQYQKDWIKVVSLPLNGGPGVARNTGWDIATQPYIAFIDADDAWHPDKLRIQYRMMADNPNVSISGHPCSKGIPENLIRYRSVDSQFRPVNRYKMLLTNPFQTPSVMLKRNLPFRFENKKYCEDYQLWLEILFSGHYGRRLEIPLAYTFKADFGEKGLSADLWQMEKGQLDCFVRLHRKNQISFVLLIAAVSFSICKYFRRFLATRIRKINKSLPI